MVHDIMELNSRWGKQRDRLLVSTSFRDGLAVPAYERMESILAYCCRWEDFTLTRWSSVSRACRLWVASLLVGLDGQMETCREDPAIGNYFIHGHDRGKRLEVRRLGLTARFASGVSDIPGQMLIEDERFMLQAESIWNAMTSEADYISSYLPPFGSGGPPCFCRKIALPTAMPFNKRPFGLRKRPWLMLGA